MKRNFPLHFSSGIYFYLVLCFYLLHTQYVSAQADSTAGSFAMEIAPLYGFVMAHREALLPLQQQHVTGFEYSLILLSLGRSAWQQTYQYPETGLTFSALNLGSPEHLGMGFAVYPFIDFPLQARPKWTMTFRYGIGFGWVEKIFSAESNYRNAAIGSHLNGVMHFHLQLRQLLTERNELNFGIGITHFSNGSTAIPNLGINIPMARIGYKHYFGHPLAFQKEPIHEQRNFRRYSAYAGAAIKKIYPPLGKNYFAGVISFMRLQEMSAKSAWGIGADLFYDASIAPRFQREGQDSSGIAKNFREGIFGAIHFSLGKAGLMFNMGYYLHTSWKEDGNFYHRICVRYYLQKLFFCMNLKTHYARADFIEWGIGWRFGKKGK